MIDKFRSKIKPFDPCLKIVKNIYQSGSDSVIRNVDSENKSWGFWEFIICAVVFCSDELI